jgi:hypothetical protein
MNAGTPALLVAVPLASNTTGAPNAIPFTTNCTDPEGVPTPGAVTATVAVNDTDSPNTDGFAELDTTVDVAACPTVNANAPDVVAA